ncbi:MAG: hypothetical protein ABH843_07825 [Candidatus Omnitrophota bacterium]
MQIYHNLFKKRAGDIGGIPKIWAKCRAVKIPEPSHFTFDAKKALHRDGIVIFKGVGDKFRPLNGWNEFLYNEILSITKECWQEEAERAEGIPIGINIRKTGFRQAERYEDFFTTGGLITPLSWFVESLKIIRKAVGFSVKAFVCSDAKKEELDDVLSMENIVFIKGSTAISDLLALSKAKVLIGSGGSNFSAWASFLGQMPTISHPGQSLKWFNVENKRGFYIGEFDTEHPEEEFIKQVRSIISPD